jgi:PAS domain S-box-containing protein
VLDHIPALIGYIDRNLQVRWANQATCDCYGRPREQLLGRTVPEIVGPELFARVRPGIDAALAGEAVMFDDTEPDCYGPGVDGVSEEHYVPRFGPNGDVVGFDYLSIETTARRRAEVESVEKERAQFRRLMVAQEEERRALAYELHEGVGQALAGLNLWLEGTDSPSSSVAGAQRLITGLTKRAARLAVDMRPPELDQFHVFLVVRGFIRRFEQRTGIQVDLFANGADIRFPDPVQTAVYRIVEEALTNVERHAGVSRVGVDLTRDQDGLTIVVRDSGRGFDPTATWDGCGLGTMREWAELLGGSLVVEAAPGSGAAVITTLPVA